MKGLILFGLDKIICKNPTICKPLFVKLNDDTIDSNFLFSIIVPEYSADQSSRKSQEEQLVDHLQDFLNDIEDTNVSGYSSAVAYQDESGENKVEEQFEAPEITSRGVMGRITDKKHKPLNGEALRITAKFDYECVTRYPNHKICFPQVSSCGSQIILPVAHMKTYDEFKHIFILGYCKGQSFGRH